jgi:hypothetical protein
LLVAISISVAVLAFLLLIGVVISFRQEIFGKPAPEGALASSVLPVGAVPDSAVQRKLAAEGVAVSKTAAKRSAGEAAPAAATIRAGSDERIRAGDGRQAGTGRGDTGHGDGGQGDSRQQPTGVKTKAPGAQPVTRAPQRVERPAAVTVRPAAGGSSGAASTAAPSTAAASAATRTTATGSTGTGGSGHDKQAGQAAPSTAAAGAASVARSERTGQDRPRSEPAAPSKDKPGPAPVQQRDRAEPHRASRLERESARAAVTRAAASSAAGPITGDQPAGAIAGSPAEGGSGGTPPGAMAGVARESDRQQQEQPSAGPPSGATGAQPEPSTQATGGAGSDQKPGKPAEQQRATSASVAGSAASTPAAADRPEPSADAPESDPRPPVPAGEPPGSADSAQVSVVPGITRYHRSDCLLIRFLSADDLEVMTRRAATESGYVPCKACKPDQQTADLAVS